MRKLKYGSLEDFKSIKIGDTVYIAEKSFTGTVTREAYYNHDSNEPSWEIETTNGIFDIYNDISVADKNELTRETYGKPKMILMCGLSGSGKSTISKELALKCNAVILSTDAIRKEIYGNPECQDNPEKVFGILRYRIRENLKNNKNIIVDATNLTVKDRRAVIHYASNYEKTLICYVINKPYEQCLIDNVNREHPVPEYVLEEQNEKFCMPTFEEGFDEIVIIDTNLLQYSNNKEVTQESEKDEPEL